MTFAAPGTGYPHVTAFRRAVVVTFPGVPAQRTQAAPPVPGQPIIERGIHKTTPAAPCAHGADSQVVTYNETPRINEKLEQSRPSQLPGDFTRKSDGNIHCHEIFR